MGLGGLEAGKSWQALDGGWPPMAIAMMTGVREAYFIMKAKGEKWTQMEIQRWKKGEKFDWRVKEQWNNEQLFAKMTEWDNVGALMGCMMSGGREHVKEDGLVTGHAYSVTNVAECSAGRVVQCRNPWGNSKEWQGEMGDTSGYWETDEGEAVAEELKYVPDSDNGLFWMPFEAFAARMTTIFVNETRAQKRNFVHEFTGAFFKMVDRRKAGKFDGPTDKEQKALRYCWDSYAEGDYINEQQLLELLKLLDMPPANEDEDLTATYNEFDIDEDGRVGWDDFFGEMMVRVNDVDLY